MIKTEEQLRAAFGSAEGLAVQKSQTKLDRFSRQFISLSPFLVLATANAQGKGDVSPRGDPPGFVRVLDDKTFIIPERPGNRRYDSLTNILANPNVSCLFFIPGFEDTLRVAGRASLTDDSADLAPMAVNGKVPVVGVKVTVDEVFLHCAKALKRSHLWDGDYRQDRSVMPSIARIIMAQVSEKVDEGEASKADAMVEEAYRSELY